MKQRKHIVVGGRYLNTGIFDDGYFFHHVEVEGFSGNVIIGKYYYGDSLKNSSFTNVTHLDFNDEDLDALVSMKALEIDIEVKDLLK